MLKYTDTQVTFSEVPDHITLCINISNCPCHCENCHSAYLAQDIGEVLNEMSLCHLIESNKGITCIAFMGGDSDPGSINKLAIQVKMLTQYKPIKVAWYSGREELSSKINLWNFDFIKLGPYKEKFGPLNKRTTNQKFYRVVHTSTGKSKLYDITYKFWKGND